MQQYSRFTDKGPSIAEPNIETIRNLLKKSMLEKGKPDCLSELSSKIKHYNNTTHHSNKLKPIDASKNSN